MVLRLFAPLVALWPDVVMVFHRRWVSKVEKTKERSALLRQMLPTVKAPCESTSTCGRSGNTDLNSPCQNRFSRLVWLQMSHCIFGAHVHYLSIICKAIFVSGFSARQNILAYNFLATCGRGLQYFFSKKCKVMLNNNVLRFLNIFFRK